MGENSGDEPARNTVAMRDDEPTMLAGRRDGRRYFWFHRCRLPFELTVAKAGTADADINNIDWYRSRQTGSRWCLLLLCPDKQFTSLCSLFTSSVNSVLPLTGREKKKGHHSLT